MENLENIKVGDKVIVVKRYTRHVRKVKRLTKTQIVVDDDKFRKSDGKSVNNYGWFSPFIRKATQELISEVEEEEKRTKLLYEVYHTDWNKLRTDKLEEVYKLIN